MSNVTDNTQITISQARLEQLFNMRINVVLIKQLRFELRCKLVEALLKAEIISSENLTDYFRDNIEGCLVYYHKNETIHVACIEQPFYYDEKSVLHWDVTKAKINLDI